jgi:predicted Zn-dependent protease
MMDFKAIELQTRPMLVEGRGAEVEALLRPLLATGTGPVVLWALLAQALRQQGRAAEARPIQEMLVDQLPGHLPTRFDLAETLLLLGISTGAGANTAIAIIWPIPAGSSERCSDRAGTGGPFRARRC